MPEIAYTLDGLADRVRALGARRVLVVCPPSRRHVDPIVAALAPLSPVVFDGAKVHVPVEVVEAAAARLADTGADTIVAVGGGSAIGLGKALRLAHDVRFVAVPTTYAGSERTRLYGTTRGRDKTTGRDERVRPDLIVYEVAFTRSLPVALTVQSLMNALAHVISAASTGSVTDFAAAAQVVRAIEDLLMWPTDARARDHALRAASACAVAADVGKVGAQHGLAHLLGGALGVDHAPLHAILLPQFVSSLPDALRGELERALGRRELDGYLHDLLVRAGAPV
ncbi:MAG: iron-containing alcohol dehydrogenase, partial [Acidobacteriota bacterium]